MPTDAHAEDWADQCVVEQAVDRAGDGAADRSAEGAGEGAGEWMQRRRDAVAAAAERLAREQQAETLVARRLVEAFVASARAAGLPTVDLMARDASGARYRTGVRGWVLRRDGSAAVGEDAAFYLLTVPSPGPLERMVLRVRGVHLVPSDPPLVMGRGGRDGDSIALADLLQRALDASAAAS